MFALYQRVLVSSSPHVQLDPTAPTPTSLVTTAASTKDGVTPPLNSWSWSWGRLPKQVLTHQRVNNTSPFIVCTYTWFICVTILNDGFILGGAGDALPDIHFLKIVLFCSHIVQPMASRCSLGE